MEYEIAFSPQLRYYARCSNVIFFAALEIHSYQACLCRTSRSSTNAYLLQLKHRLILPPLIVALIHPSKTNPPKGVPAPYSLPTNYCLLLLSKFYWYNILYIIGGIVCRLIVDAQINNFAGGDSDLVKAKPMEAQPVL